MIAHLRRWSGCCSLARTGLSTAASIPGCCSCFADCSWLDFRRVFTGDKNWLAGSSSFTTTELPTGDKGGDNGNISQCLGDEIKWFDEDDSRVQWWWFSSSAGTGVGGAVTTWMVSSWPERGESRPEKLSSLLRLLTREETRRPGSRTSRQPRDLERPWTTMLIL